FQRSDCAAATTPLGERPRFSGGCVPFTTAKRIDSLASAGAIDGGGLILANYSSRSVAVDQRAALEGQPATGNETCFVGREKGRRVRDAPGGPHLMAQRQALVAGSRNLGAAFSAHTRACVHRHGRIHEARQDDVGAYAEFSILDGNL